ncbi:serine/threonine-protein phosphatase 7 long form homolog [Ananas comosus]|uniref:Serine/threonine-protein phosphatase 7 long form homolog n=1 Tax=Ananas comosus TaxID=4615 RepID=A0A6P5FRG7_ANACO|nr:serine/threonine-protein phosphatase 7 long form homolog [Ananas comosus]
MDDHDEPGPIDTSVLTEQPRHRSTLIREEGYFPVQFTEHGRKKNIWQCEHPAMLDLLRRAGFYYVSRLRRLQLDQSLLGALVEMWRRKTQSFHLRHGEMSITLMDVAVITGLCVDGGVVTGGGSYQWAELYGLLLAVVLQDIRGSEIKIDWLYQHFHDIPLDAPPAIVRATARVYILFEIECSLFPNPSGNRVHLKWLPHLEDFDLCGELAWGAAALAHLYRALGNACIRGKVECCCFGTLVQIWAWDHLHIGRPEVVGAQPELVDMPLGCRWNTRLAFRDNVRTTDIEFYRDQLDQQLESQITWRPYDDTVLETLPLFCLAGSQVWRSRSFLVCFHIIELHHPDRVLRQFGLLQHIPEAVLVIPRINSRGRADKDWTAYHASYIQRWNNRLVDIADVAPGTDPDPIRATTVYMQ